MPCAVDEVIKNGKDVFEYSHDGREDVRLGRTRGDQARLALKNNRVMETVAYPFSLDGKRCVMEVTRDITERKHAEEALRESKERFQQLFENAPLGYQSLDESGNFIEVNETWCKTLGYTKDEIIGRNFSEFIHPDFREVFAENFPKFKKIGYILGVQFEMIKKDGSEIIVHFEGKIGHHDDGAFRQTHCVLHDVTEHERTRRERKQLEDQLRQAQKMEAVGQLAGGIAHDFNNALQAIFGFTEMTKSDLSPDDQHYQDLEQVKRAAERASKLTRQLLTFSRRQTIEPEDLNLNELITDISKMIQRTIGEHIELDLTLGAEAGAIHADPGTLEQVLLNLCLNARDAMPDGGRLVIEPERVVLDDTFCRAHLWATPGNYALIAVADTGVGMPPDVVEHIFEPFFTTKEEEKGTGLGLSMVYGIVKQHEGLIYCYSEPEGGTCFRIYLPSIERPAETEDKETDRSAPTRGTETILLAEDDELVRVMAARALVKSGYRVLVANDGEEALRLYEKHRNEIEFALLDVVMPKVGGRQVYDAIRGQKPDLPILFSSGYSTSAIHTGFILEEGLEIVQKPYSPYALRQKIREMLDGQ